METIWIVNLIISILILIFCIGFLIGGLYAYQWALYYIDIGEEYINNFKAIKEQFETLNLKIDKILSMDRYL